MFARSVFILFAFLGFGLNFAQAMDEECMPYTYESLADEEQEEVYEKYIEIILIHGAGMKLDEIKLGQQLSNSIYTAKSFLLWFMDGRNPLSEKQIYDLSCIMNTSFKDLAPKQ